MSSTIVCGSCGNIGDKKTAEQVETKAAKINNLIQNRSSKISETESEDNKVERNRSGRINTVRKDDLIGENEPNLKEIKETLAKQEELNRPQDKRIAKLETDLKGIREKIEEATEENKKIAEEKIQKLCAIVKK